MPFTAAHVLAVLPGAHWHARLRLDPTCLVIGSMAPDFEYFFRGELVGRFSHTFIGIAGWGIPVTLSLAALYHVVVKWPVLLVAPAALTPVLGQPWRDRWTAGSVLSCVVSAALGDLTHVVWDGFTHASGAFVRRIPELRAPHDFPVVGGMVTHRFLQHASTVVGLIGVGWYVICQLRHRRGSRAFAPSVGRAWPRVLVMSCMIAGVTLLELRLEYGHVIDPGNRITAAISGVLAGTVMASLILHAAGRRYRRAVEATAAA